MWKKILEMKKIAIIGSCGAGKSMSLSDRTAASLSGKYEVSLN